jgi:hypothetical protein
MTSSTASASCSQGDAGTEKHALAAVPMPSLLHRYVGGFQGGLRHGEGCMSYKHGCRYEGEWARGRMHGHGEYQWSNGDVYHGVLRRVR